MNKKASILSFFLALITAAATFFSGSLTAGAASAASGNYAMKYDGETAEIQIPLPEDGINAAYEMYNSDGLITAIGLMCCDADGNTLTMLISYYLKGIYINDDKEGSITDFKTAIGVNIPSPEHPEAGCVVFKLGAEGKKAFEKIRNQIASYAFVVSRQNTPEGSIADRYLYTVSAPYADTKRPAQNASDAKYRITVGSAVYTGKARKPEVTVTEDGKTLQKGKDYELSYKNNKNIGRASVTVTFKGTYEGSRTQTFRIIPKTTVLSAEQNGGKINLSWKKTAGAKKYQIYYREKGAEKYKKLAAVSGAKTEYLTSRLDKNKTYQFKIRSYAESDGEKYYSKFSKAVTVK